jgi:hypothetical protein
MFRLGWRAEGFIFAEVWGVGRSGRNGKGAALKPRLFVVIGWTIL